MQKIAITISPPPRTLYRDTKNPYQFQFLDDKLIITQVFKYNRIKSFIIYPEFDSKGRLHYHGILNLNHNELVRFHKHAIHKLRKLGFIDISPINAFSNNLRQIVYMSKDWGYTKDILEIDSPIMYSKECRKVPMKLINHQLDVFDFFAQYAA